MFSIKIIRLFINLVWYRFVNVIIPDFYCLDDFFPLLLARVYFLEKHRSSKAEAGWKAGKEIQRYQIKRPLEFFDSVIS